MAENPKNPILEEDDEYKKRVTNNVNTVTNDQNALYNARVNEINAQAKAQKDLALQTANQQKKDAEERYRRQYDANAIQEVLDRNALNERMANRGLTNSGLNTTQQTAIALARGNRDASVTNNQNQFIADTDLALQEVYNKADAAAAEAKLAADQERTANIENARLGYEQAYADMVNEQAKQANELKLAQYKALISAGRYDEANALLGGANGETVTGGQLTTVDPKTIPYSQRVYKKVEDPGDFGDFWGKEDRFYDPVDNHVYTEDELKDKLLGEGYTEDEASKSAKFMDDLDAGVFYTPADIESGVEPKEVFADYIIRYNLYGGNKSLQKKALVEMGYTEKEADEIVKEFSAG